jgi:cytochrome c peroxidase
MTKHKATVLAILLMGATSRWLSAAPDAPPTTLFPALPRYEAMAIPADNPMTREKVALGRQLFFDKRMSGDLSTACVSCHVPEHGLTDGRPHPVGPYGIASGRACPTLWNVGYQQAFYWEGSASSVEQAVQGIWRFVLAPGGADQASVRDVVTRLNGVPGYRRQFVQVFGEDVTAQNVPKALAAFLRTLVAKDSAWMRFQGGDRTALSPAARRGFQVFDGKAGCSQCHNGVLLTDLQHHNVGIGSQGAKPELGRFVMTRQERDRGAFKTPTLLNVGRSAPYFHDGSIATLEEAVDLMAGGGIPNPFLDGALKRVVWTRHEREDLLRFLRELTVEFGETAPQLPE